MLVLINIGVESELKATGMFLVVVNTKVLLLFVDGEGRIGGGSGPIIPLAFVYWFNKRVADNAIGPEPFVIIATFRSNSCVLCGFMHSHLGGGNYKAPITARPSIRE